MISPILAVLLFAGSTPQLSPNPPQAIAYEAAAPFGGYRVAWRFEASGQGRYLFEGPERGRLDQGELDIGPDGFERLRVTLASLERSNALSCSPDEGAYIHDEAGGVVSWIDNDRTTTTNLDFGCVSEAGKADAARVQSANDLVQRWAADARR